MVDSFDNSKFFVILFMYMSDLDILTLDLYSVCIEVNISASDINSDRLS